MHNNIVILAAGASSRMKKSKGNTLLSTKEVNQANTTSKSLISIDETSRPFLDYLLYNVKKAGYKNVYLVIGEQSNAFKKLYGDQKTNNNFNGLLIHYATQYIPKDRIKPLGTADALLQALEQYPALKEESFAVCNSDNLYSEKALKMLNSTEANHALIAYDKEGLQFSKERVIKFALLQCNSDGFLQGVIEKPSLQEMENYKDESGTFRVSMNAFKFNGKEFYNYLLNCPLNNNRNEKELPTAVLNMAAQNPEAVQCIPLSEHVPDLTSKEDIIILKDYIKRKGVKLSW